jgi:hypothetical protein
VLGQSRVPLAQLFAVGCAAVLATGCQAARPATPGATAPTTVAVIGDTPYGATQRAEFPALVRAVNADLAIRLVLHAGDTKGPEPCDDARLTDRAQLFGTFAVPFVFTPGDNDWTDCDRMGGYLPTERLDTLRRIFFPVPGHTLGERPMEVTAQSRTQAAHAEYVENVRFVRSRVVFATLHVVGSGNDLTPWTALAGGDRPAERQAEFDARRAANLDWINAAFDQASHTSAAGVVLLLQAEPTTAAGYSAEHSLIAARAARFGRPVLLIHGDGHRYEVQQHFAGVAKLTRLETFGNTASDWIELTVNPEQPAVFSWRTRQVV